MSWSYRQDCADDLYSGEHGPAIVLAEQVTSAPPLDVDPATKVYDKPGPIDMRSHLAILIKQDTNLVFSLDIPPRNGIQITMVDGLGKNQMVQAIGNLYLGDVAAKDAWVASVKGSSLSVASYKGMWLVTARIGGNFY